MVPSTSTKTSFKNPSGCTFHTARRDRLMHSSRATISSTLKRRVKSPAVVGASRAMNCGGIGAMHLDFPVLGLETAFDSLLAVPDDFGIDSIHSKWPFVGSYVRSRTLFSPHTHGHFECLFKRREKIALDEGTSNGEFSMCPSDFYVQRDFVLAPQGQPMRVCLLDFWCFTDDSENVA